ncbi:MAG: nucleotidyltransferase domain-containing protein [Acidobacteriota bacterium]
MGARHLDVFGSVARGEATAFSDVDLVVTFDEGHAPSLIDLARLKHRLCELPGTDVDVAVEPITAERLRARIAQELVRAF